MLVLEHDDPDLFTRLQEKNLARQYDLLTTFIEIGSSRGRALSTNTRCGL